MTECQKISSGWDPMVTCTNTEMALPGAYGLEDQGGDHSWDEMDESGIQDDETLEDLYDHIIIDLHKDGDFPNKFGSALMKGEPYVFSDGKRFNIEDVTEPAADESNLIHRVIEEVHNSKLGSARASHLTAILLQHDCDMVFDSPSPKEKVDDRGGLRGEWNPLEFASSDQDYMEIARTICENGVATLVKKEKKAESRVMAVIGGRDGNMGLGEQDPKSRTLRHQAYRAPAAKLNGDAVVSDYNGSVSHTGVAPGESRLGENCASEVYITAEGDEVHVYNRWQKLIRDRGTTPLHIAIASRNNQCAKYLLERMRLTEETKSVLGYRDQTGLTPLHHAVNFNKCNANQVELVRLLIELYPEALGMPSGSMVFGDEPAGLNPVNSRRAKLGRHDQEEQLKFSGPSRIKENLAPYKYFLESKEQANNSRNPTRRGNKARMGNKSMNGDDGAAGRMADLLQLSCMRYFGRDRATLSQLLDSKNQIHLDLNPRTEVTAQFLHYIADMKFEPYLQYVFIPNLRVLDVKDGNLEKKAWWESDSRKDYAYIFEWLRSTVNVKKIIRIAVEDDDRDFHSDEVIEESLKGFDIEEWNWMKWDLCSDTIRRAAPNVREIDLYWSGNKAVLKSWAAVDGLVLLKRLEKIRIMRHRGIESRARINSIIVEFKINLEQAWREKWPSHSPPPTCIVSIEGFMSQGHIAQRLSEKDLEEKGRKERWLKCTENFAQILKKWLNYELSKKDDKDDYIQLAEDKEIKVAVIDDGVDIDRDDIGKNVKAGETFYDNQGHWPGFYQSSYGHGHMMSCLIRQLCPKVKLYIAKLNELWIDGRSQITAESAAKAIEWARKMEVDVISMSWTIENVEDAAKSGLEDAVNGAVNDGILLFCACDDQGNLSDHPYPAKVADKKVFKIGSATTLGTRHKGTTETFFDYIAPGSEEMTRGGHDRGIVTSPKPRFGSSIATARCAGLAAMILQCILLAYHPKDFSRTEVRQLQHMKSMFNLMVDDGDSNKYIKVWNVFEEAMNQPGMGDDLEGTIITAVARDFMRAVKKAPPLEGAPSVTV